MFLVIILQEYNKLAISLDDDRYHKVWVQLTGETVAAATEWGEANLKWPLVELQVLTP